MKTQTVRLWDVFFIGPLMIWGGVHGVEKKSLAGTTLALLGAATIIYNGRNYLRIARG